MEKIYYIENTIDEFNTSVSGYFPTYDEAFEALKECYNWWQEKGTGRIYEAVMGLHGKRTCVYDSWEQGPAK